MSITVYAQSVGIGLGYYYIICGGMVWWGPSCTPPPTSRCFLLVSGGRQSTASGIDIRVGNNSMCVVWCGAWQTQWIGKVSFV